MGTAPEDNRVMVSVDDSKTIITENNSPDIPFRAASNLSGVCCPCCSCCCARRTHEYLGFGAGSDFEDPNTGPTMVILGAHFMKPVQTGERLNIPGITDPYQPLEGQYKSLRGCLEVLCQGPSACLDTLGRHLIVRDIPILREQRLSNAIRVLVSIPISDLRFAKPRAWNRASPPSISDHRKNFQRLASLLVFRLHHSFPD